MRDHPALPYARPTCALIAPPARTHVPCLRRPHARCLNCPHCACTARTLSRPTELPGCAAFAAAPSTASSAATTATATTTTSATAPVTVATAYYGYHYIPYLQRGGSPD
ncbi:unnamed protein product [Closterium sp. NIES-54]